MTAREMHIALDIHLQKMDSNKFGNIRKEEKDLFLNLAVYKFIKTRISRKSNKKQEGFQETQKRYDDLEELITPGVIPMYKYGKNEVYGTLPHNYYSLVNDRSVVKNYCKEIVPIETQTSKNIFIVPIGDAVPASSYQLFASTGGEPKLIFQLSDHAPYTTITAEEEKFLFINMVLEEGNSVDGVEVYYENYGGEYYQDSFIVIDDTATQVVSQQVPIVQGGIAPVNIDTINPTVLTLTSLSSTETVVESGEYPNSLVNKEDLYNRLRHPFGKPKFNTPLSTLQNGEIHVYLNGEFIVDTVNIDYIRKPRLINLDLQQNCELADHTHEEIVALALQRIKSEISEEAYKAVLNENQFIE